VHDGLPQPAGGDDVRVNESDIGVVPARGVLRLDVESFARYRDDPRRLRALQRHLERQLADDSPPLDPAGVDDWHDQLRRSHALIMARLAELDAMSDG
jgi:hypothetical protein